MTRSRCIVLILMLGVLCLASFNLAMAFLQDTTSTGPAATVVSFSTPWQLWIPFILGFFGHWYKKYVEDKVENSFINYFTTGVLGSIAAVVGGFLSFAGLYAMNPTSYPNNLGGYIGVFLISFAWDSLANGPKAQPAGK